MTEDQFIERVGEELNSMGHEATGWSDLDHPLWTDRLSSRDGQSERDGPILGQLLRAIYRVLQERES